MLKEILGGVGAAVLLFAPRAAVAESLPKIKLSPILPEFTFTMPVRMEEPPDGSHRLFVVEQDGRVWAVHRGSPNTRHDFLSITNRQPHATYEQGFLGLAFHPGFRTNRLFYVYYSQQNPRRTVVSEFQADSGDPDRAELLSERVLLEISQPSEVHKAGQVTFGPDGYLYIGVGDGGPQSDPNNTGQNTASLRGKILRIDVNKRSKQGSGNAMKELPYAIPDDNPFVQEPELPDGPVRKEIWAYGLRNPWRFSWDRTTGQLWVGDVGQDKWEEIDLITKGGNYGWCLREGAHRFKPGPEGARYIDPVVEYPHDPKLLGESKFPRHSIGMCVVGGYVYRGEKHPSLKGVFLYADFALGTIWGLRYSDGRVLEEGTLLEQPKNITSFAEDLSGELFVLTSDGHVFGIGAAQETPPPP